MDREAYDAHFELDRKHFWRIAKRRLVFQLLDDHLHLDPPLQLLDIGGACSVLSRELEKYGRVLVVEPDAQVVNEARRELGVSVCRGWLPDNLPQGPRFQVVTLLDVLEHVEDDRASLLAIRAILMDEGTFICSVPALPSLWSEHDEALHHKRRYTRAQLRARLVEAGFRIERLTYYTAFLLPLVWAQRALNDWRRGAEPARYRVRVPHPILNFSLGAIMSCERALIRRTNLPVGSSLIAVCRKGK